MDIPIYSFVAYSGTGKTTLIEKIVPILKSEGLRVAVAKHDAHDFDIDKPGKDSYRMTQAGADVTVIASPEKAVIMENRFRTLESILEKIIDVDVILTEGYKHGPWKKIALFRRANNKPPAIPDSDCYAIVTDAPIETDKPLFKLDDPVSVARFIISDINDLY